jgi:hypothetical protein
MRAHGLDLSQYNGELAPKELAKQDFLIFKISEGGGVYVQPPQMEALAKSGVKRVMGYAYLRSDELAFPLDKQIESYLAGIDLVKAISGIEVKAHWGDLERNFYSGRHDNEHSYKFGKLTHDWISYMDKNLGKAGLYTNPDTYQVGLLNFGQDWMKNYPLWIAQLNYNGWNDKLVNAQNGSWNPWIHKTKEVDWQMWQYTWHYNIGGSKRADANVWNGTVADLDKFLSPSMFDRIKRYSNWKYREWKSKL